MKISGDTAAERAVLAGLCQHGSSALVDINDLIDIDSFSSDSNKIIYKCLTSALEKSDSIDIPLILSSATEFGLYEHITQKTEMDYIKSLFNFSVKLENVRKLAGKVKKLEIAKNIQSKLRTAYEDIGKVTGNESIDHILEIAESPIFDLSLELNKNDNARPQKIFENIEEYLDHLTENPIEMLGLSTGFAVYDDIIGGGQRPGVNLIAARPANGKSSFAKQVALHMAKKDRPTLVLDTEMNIEDQIHRSLATLTDVDTRFIETGKFGQMTDRNQVYKTAKENKDIPFYYKNIAGKPFDEVISIIRRWLKLEVGEDENGNLNPCFIIYDYFKLMSAADLGNLAEYQALGFQISKLCDFCNLNKLPCLAFVQANRNALTKEDTDIISQSDRLLWLAGSVMYLRRKTAEEIAQDGPDAGNSVLITLKTRYGPGLPDNDYINLYFDGKTSKFTEIGTKSEILRRRENDTGFETNVSEDAPFED